MTNFPGLGVMISRLGGNAESVAAFKAAEGKTIASASLSDDALTLRFDDGSALDFYDDGQSCCECRYFTCDDDLSSYAGAALSNAEVREAPDVRDEFEVQHEVNFLVIETSKGAITVGAHNEHNGYYGGFSIRCRVAK